MTIDFTVRAERNRQVSYLAENAGKSTERRPRRIACLLALAHRFESLLASGEVKDYAELARLGHVSRARITQIMNLLNLAPAIQEYLLGIEAPKSNLVHTISERHLRRILRDVRWDHQVTLFRGLFSASSASHPVWRESTAPPRN